MMVGVKANGKLWGWERVRRKKSIRQDRTRTSLRLYVPFGFVQIKRQSADTTIVQIMWSLTVEHTRTDAILGKFMRVNKGSPNNISFNREYTTDRPHIRRIYHSRGTNTQ